MATKDARNRVVNKLRRQERYRKYKGLQESTKRDARFRRKREEAKDPRLREQRRQQNVPSTLERKRVWDDDLGEKGHGLGKAVDLERYREQDDEDGEDDTLSADMEEHDDKDASDEAADSMLDSESDDNDDNDDGDDRKSRRPRQTSSRMHSPPTRSQYVEPSVADSTTSTRLDLAPAALAARFPALFSTTPSMPKTLITTGINSTLHREAIILTTLFPNSIYIRRSAHRYSHTFSLREIARFASNRDYTLLVMLKEDQKRITGLSLVHLPQGPTFHFSVSNWVEGKKLPGHGNPTKHYPELILNNFRTPLGLLTAHLFRSIFSSQPDLQGRQVVTLHNQRDYIFVRRHRYIFRDKRPTEKSVVGPDGKDVKGVEEIRTGLQELGPRFTLKLRRIDQGVGRAGSGGQLEWEWKGRMDKQRTKFQL